MLDLADADLLHLNADPLDLEVGGQVQRSCESIGQAGSRHDNA